jgi:predicted metal-dependent HD superfamily phosphohydrolase
MIPTDIVQQTATHVRDLFAKAKTEHLYFHSVRHTEDVVQHAIEIGKREKVSEEELAILQVAAWFHDVGHLDGDLQDHEMRSVEAAKQFFAKAGLDDEFFIQRVTDAIMATRMPHVPADKLGEIMCDADVYHFGTQEFRKTNKRVRKELRERISPAMVTDWPQRTLKLLQSQQFFTPYSRQMLEAGKAENIRWLKKKVTKSGGKVDVADKKDVPVPTSEGVVMSDELTKEAKKAEKLNQGLLSRGIQTMLRLGSQNHLELSRMADGKANILISVNSIIISVILSVLINRLDANPHLVIPTILFLTSSVITVVIAILATRPKLTEGTFTRENIMKKETNLIFFGNFYKASLEEYTWAMNEMLQDKEYLYDTIVKDIYFLGVVLGRKYKLLRIAYNIFMVGLIVAVLAFTLFTVLNTPSGHTTVINATSSPL